MFAMVIILMGGSLGRVARLADAHGIRRLVTIARGLLFLDRPRLTQQQMRFLRFKSALRGARM
jgi:hypothetical protein